MLKSTFARIIKVRAMVVGVSVLMMSLAHPTQAATPTAVQYRDYINLVRQERQLKTLTTSYTLNRAALRRLQDMSENHYFSHTSPSGKNFMSYVQIGPAKFRSSGEILSKNYISVEKSVAVWLASPQHAKKITSSKYTHIGAAVGKITINGKSAVVAVVLFGQK